MKVGILAGGQGVRLKDKYGDLPKPLININDTPMINRLINNLIDIGYEEFYIALRERLVEQHIYDTYKNININIIIDDFQGTLETFLSFREFLTGDYFSIFTVDAFAISADYLKFTDTCKQSEMKDVDFLLGVTNFIPGDKPLWVKINENGEVTEISKLLNEDITKFTDCGMYHFSQNIWSITDEAISSGVSRLSELLNFIVKSNLKCQWIELGKVIDVDTPNDVIAAETLLGAK